MTVKVLGRCPDRFGRVLDTFVENFRTGGELGARFTLAVEGEVVVDIRGGYADRLKTRTFDRNTLAPLFSITKAIAALMVARLVDQGRLTYDQTVASIWPAFGQAGKAAITVGQVLSHQAGLAGIVTPMPRTLWFDHAAICERLAAMAPIRTEDGPSAYHVQTYGYLVDEIFRRIDGRSLGTALREDLAIPLGLDIWIGLPNSEHHRCAEIAAWPEKIELGPMNEALHYAVKVEWADPGGVGLAAWRRAELPSSNGHGTALALARLMGALATDGALKGLQILSPTTMNLMRAPRTDGRDLVLPHSLNWGAGVMCNAPNLYYGPTPEAFGHGGWGGGVAFADPARRVSGAYLMNQHGPVVLGDPRSVRLIRASYDCL